MKIDDELEKLERDKSYHKEKLIRLKEQIHLVQTEIIKRDEEEMRRGGLNENSNKLLRDIVSKILFNKQLSELTNEEIKISNKFIDDYNKVSEVKENGK